MTAEPSFSKHLDSPMAERLLDQFEAEWRGESHPEIGDFLRKAAEQSFDSESRRALLVELVLIDLWHRWRRSAAKRKAPAGAVPLQTDSQQGAGSELCGQPVLEDYVRCYPDLGSLDELPLFVIGEEYCVRHRCGDRPEHDVYFARFATQADALRRLLSEVDRQLSGDTRGGGDETLSKQRLAQAVKAEPRAASVPKLPAMPETPDMIGKYHVISVLDEGGQALVYRALHPTLAKELVIKLGRYPMQGDRVDTDRLAAEARVLAEIDHPNLGRVYDLDLHNGCPYVVMEYIRGLTLQQHVEQHPMSHREIALLMAKIARALAVAHGKGVVHQDIKPKNIMVDADGQPRIIDFGLARLRHAWSESPGEPGSVSGTIQYMAPEQARGETDQVNHRADIFSLGAVLYAILAGKPPFAGGTVREALDRASRCEFDASLLEVAGVPRGLREICLRAMSADPAGRYASAEQMASALERFAAWPSLLSRRTVVAAGAVLAALAATMAWWLMPPPKAPRDTLRHDFPIKFATLGEDAAAAPGEAPDRIVLTEGQRVTFSFEADRNCYVGVWLLQKDGTVCQLFPNKFDRNHFVEAGRPRTIPGDVDYAAVAEVSDGPEQLHVVASTAPWTAEAGQAHGPYVVFATPEERKKWEEQVRGITLKKDASPAVSELKLPLEVRPK